MSAVPQELAQLTLSAEETRVLLLLVRNGALSPVSVGLGMRFPTEYVSLHQKLATLAAWWGELAQPL